MEKLRNVIAWAAAPLLAAATGCGDTEPVDLRSYELPAGMPEYLDGRNVYAAAGPGQLSPHVRDHPAVVYVTSHRDDQVQVIDQSSLEVVDTFPGVPGPHAVVPSYDLRTLYVPASGATDQGGLLAIDPRHARPTDYLAGPRITGVFFTPDGGNAVVLAPEFDGLDFYHPRSWELIGSLELPGCRDPGHLDYSADGHRLVVGCAGNGRVVVLDTETLDRVEAYPLAPELDLTHQGPAVPRTVRLTPDGRHFLLADEARGGVHVLNADASERLQFIRTGAGAHDLAYSRDGGYAYVVNRAAGSVSVLGLDRMSVVDDWELPGTTLESAGLSSDGSTLWVADSAHAEVYALDTHTGRERGRAPVAEHPRHVTVWPQPGRYSLGHTGNLR